MSGPCLCGDPHCPRCFPSENSNEWVFDNDSVVAFGAYLAQHFDARQLQAYYEKPWKWSHEYHEWKQTQKVQSIEEE